MTKTLLQSTKQSGETKQRTTGKLKSLNANAEKESTQSAQPNALAVLKNVKMTPEETNFLMEYRRLEDLEREKGIKFFQCVGDEPHTQDFIDGVVTTRADFITNKESQMR